MRKGRATPTPFEPLAVAGLRFIHTTATSSRPECRVFFLAFPTSHLKKEREGTTSIKSLSFSHISV